MSQPENQPIRNDVDQSDWVRAREREKTAQTLPIQTQTHTTKADKRNKKEASRQTERHADNKADTNILK